MTNELTRRSLLAGSAVLAGGAFLPESAVASQAAATASSAGKAALSLVPLELKLTHPWTISRNSSTEKKNGLVALVADGVTGYGEAAANVRYGQSWESGEAAFARVKKAVEGLSPWEHLVFLERAEKEAGGDSQIVAALDMALWDWKGKKLGAPGPSPPRNARQTEWR